MTFSFFSIFFSRSLSGDFDNFRFLLFLIRIIFLKFTNCKLHFFFFIVQDMMKLDSFYDVLSLPYVLLDLFSFIIG